MRVCFAIQDMSLGGSSTVVHDIILNWPQKNDELFLIVFFNSFSDRYKDLYNLPYLKIIVLNKKRTIDLPFLKSLKAAVNLINPKVISSHLTTTFYLKLLGFHKKCNMFHTIHSEPSKDLPGIYRFFLKKDFKRRQIRLIGCCEYISKKAELLYHVPCSTIRNGITSDSSYSSCGNLVRFLFVGRFCDVKNILPIIDAFKNIEGNFVFRIIGYGLSDYENKVKQAIKVNPNVNKISLIGKKDEISPFFIDSDILILTSKREGLPMTILEGIKYGLGFIVNDVGGIREFVSDGENGLYLKNNDIRYLSFTISLLLKNPDMIKKFKKNSLAKRDLCDAKVMAFNYFEVLENE